MRYLKRGSAVRWEDGTLLFVSERGVAVEDEGVFTCAPDPGEPLPPLDPSPVERIAAEVVAAVRPPLRIERLVVSRGIAEHRAGDVAWTETHERLHLSMVNGRERALVDLGAFAAGEVREVAEALAHCVPVEMEAPPRLRLAPRVAAALLAPMAGLAPPNVQLWQTGGGFDGYGMPVAETRIEGEPWPNWYRPSYRVRPVRMPLNLRLECAVSEIDRSRPLAVALLGPPHGLTLRVLVADGERAWPAVVRVSRIDAVDGARTWYPLGGGAYGTEVML